MAVSSKPSKEEMLSNLVVEYVITDAQPLTVVENKRFRKLIAGAAECKETELPIRSVETLKTTMALVFAWGLGQIKAKLQKASAIAISLDGWRTPRAKHVQSLHIYYDAQHDEKENKLKKTGTSSLEVADPHPAIRPRRAPQMVLAGMLPIVSSHSASNIAEVVRMGLNRIGVDTHSNDGPTLLSLTADGASNCIAAATELGIPHMHCAAHLCNLIVTVSLTSQSLWSTLS